MLAALRTKAFEIAGQPLPEIAVPEAPEMLAINDPGEIRWRGSAGAAFFCLERQLESSSDWTPIATGIDGMENPGFALCSDETALVGKTYRYRMIAIN